MKSHPTKYIPWIDTAKGLGILLVVIGHIAAESVLPIGQPTAWGIFLFHMPLFFILSGYLFQPRQSSNTWIDFIKHKAIRLLVPYLCFFNTYIFYFSCKSFLYRCILGQQIYEAHIH